MDESKPDPSELSRDELEREVRRLRREQAETQERSGEESSAFFRYVSDHLQDALFLIDVHHAAEDPTFTIEHISSRHQEYTGLTNQDVAGRPPHELFDREMADHVTARYRRCVEQRRTIEYDEKLNFPAGTRVWHTELTPVEEDGRVEKLVGRSRPLSARMIPGERSRFRKVIDVSGNAIMITDPDGQIQYVNEAFEEITGYDADEAIGNTPSMLNSGVHEDAFFRELWETISGGEVWRGDIVNRTKSGDLYSAKQTIAPAQTSQGEVWSYVAIQQDVTEKKEERRKHRRKSRAMDSAPIGITMTDPTRADNPIVYANKGFERITGYSEDETLGRNCRFLQGPDTREEPVDKLRRAIREERTAVVELRNYRKDGSMFWNRVTISPLPDENGRVTRFIGFQEDITERVQAREDAEATAEFLESVNDRMPGVTYQFKRSTDGTYSFPYVSQGYKDLGGVTAEEAENDFDKAMRHVHPDDRAGLMQSIEAVLDPPRPWTHTFRYRLPDGRVNWVLASSTPEKKPDGSIVWSGVMVDISDRKKAERALEKNERRFRTIYEEANEPMIIFSLDDDILDLNPAAVEHLLHDADELVGDAIDRILPSERTEGRSGSIVQDRLNRHGKRLFHTEHLRADGTRVPVELSQTPIEYRGRQAVLCFARDLSRLEWSRRRMRAIFDSTHSFIGLLDPEGRVIELNRTMLDALSSSQEELRGRSLVEMENWWLTDNDRAAAEQALETARQGDFTRFQTQLRHADGHQRNIDFTLTPIFDKEESLIYLVLEGRDVTDRERRRRELDETRRREERFRQLAETVGVIFWLYDPDEEEYLYLSADCDRLYGVSCDALDEDPGALIERIHPDDREEVRQLFEEQLEDGFDTRYRVRAGDDDWVWVHDRAYPVTESGEVTMVAGIAEDVTETVEKERKLNRQIKETERISKLKSDFVARTTHDLRTPLNAVLGHADLLRETDLTPEQLREVDQITRASRSMLHLTNDILDLDQIENGTLELHEKPVRIRSVIEDVMSLFRPTIRESELTLTASIDDRVPARIQVDPDRFKQILVNLVGNAVKFTKKGRVNVRVRCSEPADPELDLIVSVEDTGPGISPDEQEAIFKEREKGRGEGPGTNTGAGLGLSITQHLVRIMGGEIRVDSKPGQGTTFTFHIGVTAADETSDTPSAEEEQISLDERHVLIVDDSAPIRSLLKRILEPEGVRTPTASSAAEALDMLIGPDPIDDVDVVILDRHLSDGSGSEVLKRLDAEGEGPDPERVYVLSGDPRESVRSSLPDIPIAGILEKPVDGTVLKNSIRSVLRRFDGRGVETSSPSDLPHELSRHALIAEDEPQSREILRRFLDPVVERITEVSSGDKAVEKRFSDPPEVILMDLRMPNMNGLDAIRAIRRREADEGLDPVPIIVQTARAMKQVQTTCEQAGADAFLKKPIERPELLRNISDVLERDGH